MATTSAASDPRPGLSRLAVVALVTLLAGHLALVGWLYVRAVTTSPLALEYADFGNVAGWTLALAALAFWQWPHRTRAVAVAAAFIALAALFGLAAAATVLLMLLCAHVSGNAALRWMGLAHDDAEATPSSVVTLVGIALWIGVIGATLSLKVHFPAVYAVMLALPLVALPRRTAATLRRAAAWLATPDSLTSREGAWIAVVVVLGALHAALAARPEVGYDATAMHLQFAQMLQHDHRWRFDVQRHAWAAMPLGADLQFAAAYMLDGERAARLLNLAFAGLAGVVAFDVMRLHARREIALAGVALLLSAPLVFLETSSLFVEGLWTAFLLASLYAALRWARGGATSDVGVLLLCAAGAMQCKVISVAWLAPMLVAVGLAYARRRDRPPLRPLATCAVIAAVVALWPYANAWLRTGNPVFPFFNAWFRSPLFDATVSLRNELYNTPLRPWSFYTAVLESGRHIEGWDGAAGLQWLLLYPLILVGAFRRPPRDFWYVLTLAALFFVVVYSQQPYLRYLVPWFVLVTVLAAWSLEALPSPRVVSSALLVVGVAVCALNVTLVHTANWVNTTLCLRCTYDPAARQDFILRYAALRAVAERLNREVPEAHVGFFVLNGTGATGYIGYSRAANWHDWDTFMALANAATADDVASIVRRSGLTHIVFSELPTTPDIEPLRAYVAKRTTPLWKLGGFAVVAVRPD